MLQLDQGIRTMIFLIQEVSLQWPVLDSLMLCAKLQENIYVVTIRIPRKITMQYLILLLLVTSTTPGKRLKKVLEV